MEKTQRCRFAHPLRNTFYEADVPVGMTFKEIEKMLIGAGFITPKKGGYQFIFEDRLLKLGAPLSDYVPEGSGRMDIRVHALLVVLT